MQSSNARFDLLAGGDTEFIHFFQQAFELFQQDQGVVVGSRGCFSYLLLVLAWAFWLALIGLCHARLAFMSSDEKGAVGVKRTPGDALVFTPINECGKVGSTARCIQDTTIHAIPRARTGGKCLPWLGSPNALPVVREEE